MACVPAEMVSVAGESYALFNTIIVLLQWLLTTYMNRSASSMQVRIENPLRSLFTVAIPCGLAKQLAWERLD
jgi:hypothetical protein